jgi:hypothetical protein
VGHDARVTTARLRPALLLLATTLLALAWRWPLAADLNLGSDGLGQWSGALAVLSGGWPRPPNPEGGHSLWIFGLPPVLLGRSLLGVAQVRVAMAALVAPLGAATAALLAAPRLRLPAGALAGVLLAVDPGLLDTLHVAFRGYGAPELVALAGLGLALAVRGRRAGPALFVAGLFGAAGQHPMAGGVLLVGLLGLVLAHRSLPERSLVPALVLGGLLALPRLHWLWQLGQCGAGLLPCLERVASGSSEPGLEAAAFLRRALHDRFWVDWPGTALSLGGVVLALVAAGAPGASKESRSALSWAILATVGVLGLGLAVSSLRPYHLRIVAAPLAVAAALGAVRVWPVAVAATLALPLVVPRPVVVPGEGGPAAVDALARELLPQLPPGPVRVDAAWFGDPVGLEPAPLVLSFVLQGVPEDRFVARAAVPTVLLVNTDQGRPAAPQPPVATWTEGHALLFSELDAAQGWVAAQDPAPVVAGGAADWVGALHPSDPTQDAVSW